MARFDIMPFKSPLGGTYEVRYAPLTATQVFDVGELIGVADAGSLTQFPQDATQAILADMDTVGNLCGIAAFGPGQASASTWPTARINTDWRTGAAFATGAMIGYWPADQGILFITDNFTAAGAGSAVVPAGTDRGEIYQITYATFGTPDSGWGVEQTAGARSTDVCAVVVDVLNTRKEPIGLTDTTTGVYVVFEIQTR